MIKRAAKLLDVPENEIQPFTLPDTFNGGQVVEGFICHRSDHRYGALVICRVAGQDVPPQVVYATPKLHYPFDKCGDGERKYKFPRASRVEVYDKLDGTNVCAYVYHDANGNRFLTYKTRLVPIMQAGGSKWGDFAGMWSELLETQEGLRVFCEGLLHEARGSSYSFEMHGYRNPHLIAYKVPLAAAFLFSVGQGHPFVSPPFGPQGLCPVAVLESPRELARFYEEKRMDAERRNFRSPDGEMLDGTEGFVFYVLDEDGIWTQWKCKPPSVETEHWTTDYIPEDVIWPTAKNALESVSLAELNVEYVKTLLLEEFTASQVNNSTNRIEKVIAAIRDRMDWIARVQKAYTDTGLAFDRDGKGPVMRAMSACFDRSEMKKVFGALRELGVTP